MTEKPPEVLAINRTREFAILDCDCQVPVTEWYNSDGDDCEPTDAIVCVCGDDAHGWFMVDLQGYTVVTVH